MAPPFAKAPIRAAKLVTGPDAVNVQRVPVAPSNLVEPTAAKPELIPIFTVTGAEVPCSSALMRCVLARIARAVRTAAHACACFAFKDSFREPADVDREHRL